MKDIEKYISPLIETQFPSFYREEGQNFIAFVKAYYEWLESNDQVLYKTRRLLEYGDIDTTLDEFILYFKEKYLKNIQFTTDSNKRLFIKHALDFYRSKGSERAVDLFFRLIYGIPATVYTPSQDVFRLSASEYIKPLYLEVTKSTRNIDFVGKQITGSISGATAFVERLVRKMINSQTVEIFFISNLKKNFEVNEIVFIDDDLDNSPRIIGSLTSLEIVNGGSLFSNGELVLIDSTTTGAQGKALVRGIEDVTGLVDFSLVDGGWGYTSSANVIVSEKVLIINNVSVPTSGGKYSVSNTFSLFETISQPLANITFNTLSGGTFAANDIVNRYYSNGNLAATGRILSVDANTTLSNGQMFISVISGNALTGNTTLYLSGNAVTANITSNTDKTASANVMGVSTNVEIICTDGFGTFEVGEEIYQSNATTYEAANGIVTLVQGSSANLLVTVSSVRGIFKDGERVYGRRSTANANLSSFSTRVGLFDVTNDFTTLSGNFIVASNTSTTANIHLISSGTNATFSVGNLQYQNTITYNSDLLSSNNANNVSFMDSGFIINGSSGTGFSSNGYGFIKNPSANINSTIMEALSFANANVGSIRTITSVDQGSDYNADSFVLIYEASTTSMKANCYTLTIVPSTDLNFSDGELIKQTKTISNVNVLSVSNVTTGNVQVLTINSASVNGTFPIGATVYQSNGTANIGFGTLQTIVNNSTYVVNAVSNSFSVSGSLIQVNTTVNASITDISYRNFEANEYVYQSNGTSNVAVGIVESVSINAASNSGTITVNSISANFSPSNSTSLSLVGTILTVNAYVDSVNTANQSVITQGLIENIPNTSLLQIKRLTTRSEFEVGQTVVGVDSLASGTIDHVLYSPWEPDVSPSVAESYEVIGLGHQSGIDAIVDSDVTIANGSVTSLSVLDSGFGYSNGDVLEFTSEDGSKVGTAKLILQKQGTGEGYFINEKGFLSNDSHLFDGEFYQEYSYQVISRLPFDRYADMFKRVAHTAGSAVFGKVSLEESVNTIIVSANVNIGTANVTFINISNAEIVSPGLFVYQSNGTSNTANGYIDEYPSAEVILSQNAVDYEIGSTIYQPSIANNAANGIVSYRSSNDTHTTLYLSNTRGTFLSSANVEGIHQRIINVTPLIDVSIKTINNASNTSQSFNVGETIYQGAVSSETFIGTVISANSSKVRVTTTSGSITDNSLLISSNTAGRQANATSHTSNTFTSAQTIYQEIKTLSLVDINNANTSTESFNVGEEVYQYKVNSTSPNDLFNVKTATAIVTNANSTAIKVINVFGNLSNTREIRGVTSNAYAVINGIVTQNTATGNVVSSNDTVLIVKEVTGAFTTNNHIKGSNCIANATTVSSNSQVYQASNVESTINILIIANTQGTFSANSSANGITVLYANNDTAASANLTTVKIDTL